MNSTHPVPLTPPVLPPWRHARLGATWWLLMALMSSCVVAQAQEAPKELSSHMAQMTHMAHMASSAPSRAVDPQECVTQALACAQAATPLLQADGSLLLLWTANGSVMLAKSADLGQTFSPAVELAQHGKFLDTGSDARAQIIGDDTGRVLIAYAFFKDRQWNAQINVLTSTDAGLHFSEPKALIKNGVSERFPSLGIDQDRRVYVAWVDKRWVHQQRANGVNTLGGSIAINYTDDWAQSFKAETLVNPQSCECCRIGMDVSSAGPFALAYRAIFDKGVRDSALQMISPQGPTKALKAHAVQRVAIDHWQTDVCPHHGPAVAIGENQTLHTVWFTQGEHRKGLFYARSDDHGRHFSAPMAMGDVNSQESRPFVLAQGREAWMVWKRFDGVHSSVWLRHSDDDGHTWSPETSVSQTASYSDHPLLIKHQGRVYVSWFTRMEGYRLMALNS